MRQEVDGERVNMVRSGEFLGLPALEGLMRNDAEEANQSFFQFWYAQCELKHAILFGDNRTTGIAGTGIEHNQEQEQQERDRQIRIETSATRVRSVTTKPTRAMVWNLMDLRTFLHDPRNKDAEIGFMRICNARLMAKLDARGGELAHRKYQRMLQAVVERVELLQRRVAESRAVASTNGVDNGNIDASWGLGGVAITADQKRMLRAYRRKHQVRTP